LSFRFDNHTLEKIREWCRKKNISESELIREAVVEYLGMNFEACVAVVLMSLLNRVNRLEWGFRTYLSLLECWNDPKKVEEIRKQFEEKKREFEKWDAIYEEMIKRIGLKEAMKRVLEMEKAQGV